MKIDSCWEGQPGASVLLMGAFTTKKCRITCNSSLLFVLV